MKRNYRKAYTALKKMGVPVIEGGWNGDDKFSISAEMNEHDTWADYYAMDYGVFGVKQSICDVLDKHGLFAEWINPGVVGVCEV